MLHFETIIPNLQLDWKREQSGVRSTWEPAGAHSGVVVFSDFLPFSITANSSNRSLTFSYLSVLVSCLRSLACASNAAHWRNNRNDMPVSIYCLSHPQTDSLRLASNGVTVALLWWSSSFIIPEMVKFVLPYIHFDDIKPSDTYQKLVFSLCVSKHYSWALATSLFRPYENATLGNV